MRKGIVFFGLYFLVSWQQVYSQVKTVNIHGSYSKVELVNNNTYNQTANAWSTGIGGLYDFNRHVSIVSEINYELKGAEGTISYYNIIGDKLLSYNKRIQLHYVTLPLMARFSVGKKRMKPFLNVGMYYGFLGGAWVNPQDKGISHNITADFKRNDLGLAGGLGVQFLINSNYSLSLEWRNHHGLYNVSKSMNNQYNESNLIQVGVYCKLTSSK